MSKYDSIRMSELVSVKDDGKTLVLVFADQKQIRISVSDGSLVSVVS